MTGGLYCGNYACIHVDCCADVFHCWLSLSGWGNRWTLQQTHKQQRRTTFQRTDFSSLALSVALQLFCYHHNAKLKTRQSTQRLKKKTKTKKYLGDGRKEQHRDATGQSKLAAASAERCSALMLSFSAAPLRAKQITHGKQMRVTRNSIRQKSLNCSSINLTAVTLRSKRFAS